MVAPINATASIDAGGETITLRLNFATIDAARKAGADLFRLDELHPIEMAVALRCLAASQHPELTDEQAFALFTRHADAVGVAFEKLFAEFGAGDEGNVEAPVKRAKPGKKAT